MIKLFLIIIVVGLAIFGGFQLYSNFEEDKQAYQEDKQAYQGPIPLGYDLDHFRKTGETIEDGN